MKKDLGTLCLHLSICISLQNASRTALAATNTIKLKTFLIFDIGNNKTQGGQTKDWNDKNDNANYAPSYHMEGLQRGLPFLKKYSIRSTKKI